jgi:hypothetical protein
MGRAGNGNGIMLRHHVVIYKVFSYLDDCLNGERKKERRKEIKKRKEK